MQLYKHQQEFLTRNPDRHGLFWDMGLGKTLTAILWANARKLPTLFIVPKMLKTNWNLALADAKKGQYMTLVVSKEEFRRDWEKYKTIEAVVIDECHFFANKDSQLSKSFQKFIKKNNIEHRLLQTGTPYTASPWSIYTLAVHLGHPLNWRRFRDMFFTEVRMGHRIVPVAKKGKEKQLAAIANKIGSTLKLSDATDIPEQSFVTEYFDLTPAQEKARKEIYDPVHVVEFTRLHELEAGYTAEGEVGSYKNDRLMELVKEHEKIIIVCRYNKQIDVLKKLLGDCYIIRGDVKDRSKVVERAEKAKRAIVLIQSACCVGFELPSFSIMVFASLDFSYVNYRQMCGRILRINALHKNLYVHLLTKNGVDEDVYAAMERKEDFHVAIFNK